MSLAQSTAAGRAAVVVLDEESREWLRCLAGTGRDGRHTAEREEALARLHELLLRAAHADLRRRSRPGGVEGRERDDLAHQAADDALLAITSKLDRFRGDSRFATCAYKFVMFEVSAKLGRHHWRNPPVQAGDDAWERTPDRFGAERPAAPRLRRDRRRRDPARRATRSTRRCSTRGERSARTWSLTDTWTKNRGRHDRMARAR